VDGHEGVSVRGGIGGEGGMRAEKEGEIVG